MYFYGNNFVQTVQMKDCSCLRSIRFHLNKRHYFKLQSEVQVKVPPVMDGTHPTEFSEI